MEYAKAHTSMNEGRLCARNCNAAKGIISNSYRTYAINDVLNGAQVGRHLIAQRRILCVKDEYNPTNT